MTTPRHRHLQALLALLIGWGATACATTPGRTHFSGEVVWEVDDRRPIPKPEERWAGKWSDGIDNTLLRPITEVFRIERHGPAANANALGGVPNSSWFTNRLSRRDISPERLLRGPCDQTDMPEAASWTIRSGKVQGFNPGFVADLHHPDGTTQRYLLKFEGRNQSQRAVAADVLGSKIYWAAGFEVPCNRLLQLDPDKLVLDPEATKKDPTGRKIPLTRRDVARAMGHAPRDEQGHIRTMASKFLPGEPLGPFSYLGRRADDLNDAIPHEDRRELRGSRLIAAWTNHFDSRDQNTYTAFFRADPDAERGYVQHFLLDFGDLFGARWFSEGMTRRLGYSTFVHPGHILSDWLTLGAIPRPWHSVDSHPAGEPFGYFDVDHFNPETWRPGFPNPAFQRMDARDAFWATNIISRFSDAHIDRLAEAGRFSSPAYTRFLAHTLRGRRDQIVATYFRRYSPMVAPRVEGEALCLEDAWVGRGFGAADDAFYDRRLTATGVTEKVFATDWQQIDRTAGPDGRLCLDLPAAADWPAPRGDLVVQVRARRTDQTHPARPARFHLRPEAETDTYRIVGILRVGDRP
jgi:hypothetical protein